MNWPQILLDKRVSTIRKRLDKAASAACSWSRTWGWDMARWYLISFTSN